MKTRFFSKTGLVCLALVMSNFVAQPAAAQPQTETITFGVLVAFDFYEDPMFVLDDGVGPDTNGIFTGKFDPGPLYNLVFTAASPDCEDVVVAGTIWSTSNERATIINRGGPVYGLIVGTAPPERYMLLDRDITAVRACWLVEDGNGKVTVQATPDPGTDWAFYIVTGEFRVND